MKGFSILANFDQLWHHQFSISLKNCNICKKNKLLAFKWWKQNEKKLYYPVGTRGYFDVEIWSILRWSVNKHISMSFQRWTYNVISTNQISTSFQRWNYNVISTNQISTSFQRWSYNVISTNQISTSFQRWNYNVISTNQISTLFQRWNYNVNFNQPNINVVWHLII